MAKINSRLRALRRLICMMKDIRCSEAETWEENYRFIATYHPHKSSWEVKEYKVVDVYSVKQDNFKDLLK